MSIFSHSLSGKSIMSAPTEAIGGTPPSFLKKSKSLMSGGIKLKKKKGGLP
jgi:hypothetical protein